MGATRKYTGAELAAALEAVRGGEAIAAVARRTGRHSTNLSAKLRKLGWNSPLGKLFRCSPVIKPQSEALEPTAAAPGSPEKCAVLAGRYERGERLWHERDAGVPPREGLVTVRRGRRHGAAVKAAAVRDRPFAETHTTGGSNG